MTAPVTFNITVKDNNATTTFKIDRTKYDIKFHSKSLIETLKDQVIDDEFELTVSLKLT